MARPTISIVIVSFNMKRELPRTLFTLFPPYQKGINKELIEVIVVDNGSEHSPDTNHSAGFNIKFLKCSSPSPSPALAINEGLANTSANLIGVMIDGARMLSPRVLSFAFMASKMVRKPVISTHGYHLGPKTQMISVLQGYNQSVEDDLLSSVNWRVDGYELFKVSSFAGSSNNGWFQSIGESNALFMTKEMWMELDGFDEKFVSAGGGFANLDVYVRALELKGSRLISLLGEGSFHQIHGGITTNDKDNKNQRAFAREYERIRNKKFKRPNNKPIYLGSVTDNHRRQLQESTNRLNQKALSRAKSKVNHTKVVFILGMHRSGTSCLAGSLRQLGVYLGEVVNESPFNRKGNQEKPSVYQLHESLLNSVGASWDKPQLIKNWPTEFKYQLANILPEFERQLIWGIKDPRLLFTIDGWLETLSDLDFIFVASLRHPSKVANSLNARDGLSHDMGLNLWHIYNKRLIDLSEKFKVDIVNFDDVQSYSQQINEFANHSLNLNCKNLDLDFYDGGLINNSEISSIPDDIRETYEKLIEKCIKVKRK